MRTPLYSLEKSLLAATRTRSTYPIRSASFPQPRKGLFDRPLSSSLVSPTQVIATPSPPPVSRPQLQDASPGGPGPPQAPRSRKLRWVSAGPRTKAMANRLSPIRSQRQEAGTSPIATPAPRSSSSEGPPTTFVHRLRRAPARHLDRWHPPLPSSLPAHPSQRRCAHEPCRRNRPEVPPRTETGRCAFSRPATPKTHRLKFNPPATPVDSKDFLALRGTAQLGA